METATDQASGAVVPLSFAALCFAIAGPALFAGFIAAHVWLAATILLRLCTGAYVKAGLWLRLLAALVYLDVNSTWPAAAARPNRTNAGIYELKGRPVNSPSTSARGPTPAGCRPSYPQQP